MNSNWQKIKLSDVCEVIGGGTPSTKNYDFWNGDIPWLTPKDLSGYNSRYISKGERNIAQEGLQNSSAHMLPKGSVLLTSRAPIGYVAIAKNDVCTNQGFKSLVLKKGYCSEFFYYLLKNNIEYIVGMGSGSTFAEISGTQVKNLEFTVPPLDIQKKIARVLGVLDDKIELNNKINNNLEQQAQALFKSWFVDFEPFGGTMPDDWKEINLSDIATFVGGYSYKGSELQTSSTAMATIKNFDRKGGFKLDGFKEILPSSKLKETQKADLFDIFVAHTDLTQNADVIGNAEMLLSKAGYVDVIISMDVVKVMPQKGISKFLLAALLKDNRFKQHCLGYINGTTVLHLSKKALPEYTFAFPNSVDTVNELTQTLEYLYKKLALNIEENTRLAQLRDTLLPKLMSGEIDVSNVDISELSSNDKSSFSEE